MTGLPSGLVESLRAAQRVVALTGAGVSAESGIPTFREAQTGLWERYDPRQLATPEAFSRDPGLVWRWYAWRRELVGRARPNPGHLALAELERAVPAFALVTQNVDGLHQEAGNGSVIELHGNIRRTRCSVEGLVIAEPRPEPEQGVMPPVCPNCGAPLRPDVVWFGEALPEGALDAASEATRRADVFLSVGTSGLVYPAAAFAHDAANAGATVVEINPDETPLTPRARFAVRGRAGAVLPALVGAAFG